MFFLKKTDQYRTISSRLQNYTQPETFLFSFLSSSLRTYDSQNDDICKTWLTKRRHLQNCDSQKTLIYADCRYFTRHIWRNLTKQTTSTRTSLSLLQKRILLKFSRGILDYSFFLEEHSYKNIQPQIFFKNKNMLRTCPGLSLIHIWRCRRRG